MNALPPVPRVPYNSAMQEASPATTRTLAIGDIHGCKAALDTLLGIVQPTPEDLIVTLGDYVDRGPDTKGVLDRVIQLHRFGRVVSLRGNHEVMMLAARDAKSAFKMWLPMGGSEALESYRDAGKHVSLDDVPERHWLFMEETCKGYFETATHIFVHANLDHKKPLAKQDDDDLYWEKLDRDKHKAHVSGKIMVCGHTVQKAGFPLNLGSAICIDTWAYGDGWLTCLHAETGRFWQANELGQTREGRL